MIGVNVLNAIIQLYVASRTHCALTSELSSVLLGDFYELHSLNESNYTEAIGSIYRCHLNGDYLAGGYT